MRKRWRITVRFIVLLFIYGSFTAQASTENDTRITNPQDIGPAYIDSLNKAAFSIFRTNPRETRKIALKSLSLSKTINYSTGQGKAFNYIAMTYHISGNYDSSYICYQKSLDIFEQDEDTVNMGKIYNNLALLFNFQEYYNLALEYNLKSLGIAIAEKNPVQIFHSYNNIGITYERLEEYNKALESYQYGLETIKDAKDTEEFYYYAVSNIGIINLLTNQLDSAEHQLKEGLDFFTRNKDNYGISQAYRFLAEIYLKRTQFKQSEEAIRKSKYYANRIDDKKLFTENQFLLARIHFEKKKYSEAVQLFDLTLKTALDNHYNKIVSSCYLYLYKTDSILGNYQNALNFYRKYSAFKDSITSQKMQKQIAQFSIQYQSFQKDIAIEKLEQKSIRDALQIEQQQNQRDRLYLILIAISVLLFYGIYSQRKIRIKNKQLILQKEEINQKNNELTRHKDHLEELVKERTAELERAYRKALESDKLKSAFLANISHEIRTPMNGILGFANMLNQPGLEGKQQQKYLEIIKKSGNRMLSLINELIDISKIESGQESINTELININEQFDYLFDFFNPEAKSRNLTLLYKRPEPDVATCIKTDKDKFTSIISNLIKNAIKYTETGSIEYSFSKTDKYLKFYVKDTGHGIPEENLKSVFEPFNQAELDKRLAKQGVGLGLAIARAYVQLLGGNIWVESKINEGSVFYFTIPNTALAEEPE